MAATSVTIEEITGPAGIDRAVAVLTLSFSADPIARWVYGGDPHLYLTHFPPFVHAFGGNAFGSGTAYGMKGGIGTALWLPPDVHVDDEALGSVMERTLSPEKYAAMGTVFSQMAQYHPKEPHWYLPLIGIDSFHQNKGHGSVLMQHALQQCDRDHVAAYLESTNPRNISFYQRHGFEVLSTIVVDPSCSISPMLRRAR
jgi:GNAT superfamily N-acetyltransferase